MLKKDEISDPNSCWNKARLDERVFILLERDLASPVTIQSWVNERIRTGKNTPSDAQILEAVECAHLMWAQKQKDDAIKDAIIDDYF